MSDKEFKRGGLAPESDDPNHGRVYMDSVMPVDLSSVGKSGPQALIEKLAEDVKKYSRTFDDIPRSPLTIMTEDENGELTPLLTGGGYKLQAWDGMIMTPFLQKYIEENSPKNHAFCGECGEWYKNKKRHECNNEGLIPAVNQPLTDCV